jgi:hypothetical protein
MWIYKFGAGIVHPRVLRPAGISAMKARTVSLLNYLNVIPNTPRYDAIKSCGAMEWVK